MHAIHISLHLKTPQKLAEISPNFSGYEIADAKTFNFFIKFLQSMSDIQTNLITDNL
jgi:hypothetical protein